MATRLERSKRWLTCMQHVIVADPWRSAAVPAAFPYLRRSSSATVAFWISRFPTLVHTASHRSNTVGSAME